MIQDERPVGINSSGEKLRNLRSRIVEESGKVSAATVRSTIKPAIQRAAHQFVQFSPMHVLRAWSYENPLARKIQDIRFDYDYNKHKNDEGFHNPIGSTPPQAIFNGPSVGGGYNTSNQSSDKETVSVLQTGFAKLSSGLIDLLMSVRALASTSNASAKSTKKSETLLASLVTMFNKMFNKQPLADSEASREGNLTSATNSEGPANDEPGKKSWIASLISGALGGIQGIFLVLAGGLKGLAGRVQGLFKTQTDKIVKLTDNMFEAFKTRFPKMIQNVFASIKGLFEGLLKPITNGFSALSASMKDSKLFAGAAKALSTVFDLFKPLAGVSKLLLRGAKAIPVIGQFVLAITAIVDGITGFVKGFNSQKGSLLAKLKEGSISALEGIVKGLAQPFAWIAEQVKKIFTKLVGVLGFDKLAEKLDSFDITKVVDDFFTALFDGVRKIDPNKILTGILDIIKQMVTLAATKGTEAIETGKAAAKEAVYRAKDTAKTTTTAAAETAERLVYGKKTEYTGVKGLLDQISIAEGTTDSKVKRMNKQNMRTGYDVPLAYGNIEAPPKPLSEMTLDEVDAYQTKLLRSHKNDMNSSAVGKYQIVQTTLRGLRKQLKLTGKEKFDSMLQDRLATQLLERRGLKKFVDGKISKEQFQNNLAQEWASIPRSDTGRSHYGQRTGTSQHVIGEVLTDVKAVDPTAVKPAPTSKPPANGNKAQSKPPTVNRASLNAHNNKPKIATDPKTQKQVSALAQTHTNNASNTKNNSINMNNQTNVNNTSRHVVNNTFKFPETVRYPRNDLDGPSSYGNRD